MTVELLAILCLLLLTLEWGTATFLPWQTLMSKRQRVGIVVVDVFRVMAISGCFYLLLF